MNKLTLYTAILCMSLCGACKENDYVYPSVLTEFINAQTDGNGVLSHLITDNGKTYVIQPRDGLSGLSADTLYRSVSIYEPLTDGTENNMVKLYQCQFILAPTPVPSSSFKDGIKTDPADIERIWRSGEYINMVLDVRIKDKKHTYHFIDEGIEKENDCQVLKIRLYHDSQDDYEAYTHKAYLSIPLESYREKLNKRDKIRFYVNTYSQGVIQKEFDY